MLPTEILLPRIARLTSNCSAGNCLPNFNEDKLEKLELNNLSSMRVSNRVILPSEVLKMSIEEQEPSSWSFGL